MSDPLVVAVILPALLGAVLGLWNPRSPGQAAKLLFLGTTLLAIGVVFIFTLGVLLIPIAIIMLAVVAGSGLRAGMVHARSFLSR